jgi:hypothetical protein
MGPRLEGIEKTSPHDEHAMVDHGVPSEVSQDVSHAGHSMLSSESRMMPVLSQYCPMISLKSLSLGLVPGVPGSS